jgi:hypothetical protein
MSTTVLHIKYCFSFKIETLNYYNLIPWYRGFYETVYMWYFNPFSLPFLRFYYRDTIRPWSNFYLKKNFLSVALARMGTICTRIGNSFYEKTYLKMCNFRIKSGMFKTSIQPDYKIYNFFDTNFQTKSFFLINCISVNWLIVI